MPALTSQALYWRLRAALPAGSTIQSPADETHPMLATVTGFGQVRAYLWTVTRDQSAHGRPPDELKIQLILPGQGRGNRGRLDLSPPHYTVLLGFAPDFGVFVGWEASYYQDFGYSRNVQVREALLTEARDSAWAVAEPRLLRTGEAEVRVAFGFGNFGHYLTVSKEADDRALTGYAREAHFLWSTPNVALAPPPVESDLLERYSTRQRQRLAASRLSRDAQFSPRVKEAYGFSCAICGVQMETIESAHIIPVAEEGSTDDVWNGIALCPTHHKLFDAHVLIIRDSLEIAVDLDAVQHLRDRGRGQGVDYFVMRHQGASILQPSFFSNPASSAAMVEALRRRQREIGQL